MNKEVRFQEPATISCVVNGLTKILESVKWEDSSGQEVTSDMSDYTVVDGSYESNSQTTTLTVVGTKNTADTDYKCVIESAEWAKTGANLVEKTVSLNVFSKLLSKCSFILLFEGERRIAPPCSPVLKKNFPALNSQVINL